MRRRLLLPLIFIPVAALAAVLPLIVHGCSCGHDFDFHLISWMEAAAQFKAGVWHPAWAFSPAWNAGEPRFVFYPPVSWTLGALLGMALPWGAVPVVYTGLALVAAGFAMYSLARALEASPAAGLIAAAVYMANPYMIFTAYERTAYAELLAAAWIPLLLAAVLRERVTALRLAIPVALLWLTNAPAAVMGCYSLALLVAVRVIWMWRSSTARECAALLARAGCGVALGLGLAAFYVLPAAYERRWVQIAMAMVSGMRIGDNFLFHHTNDPPHDEVLHWASVIAVVMLVAAAVVLTAAALRLRDGKAPDASKRTVVSLAVLAGTIGLLLTPLSASVWRVAPEMAFLQFPWRLTAVLAAAVCGGMPLAIGTLRSRPVLLASGALVLVAAMSWPAVHHFRQACDEEDTVASRLAVFNAKAGTDPTDEYTPGGADNDALGHGNPPYWVGENGDAQPAQGAAGPVPMHFTVDAAQPEALVLNLRDYPAWAVRINGVLINDRTVRADGLIALPRIAGHSQIDVEYATTRDRRIGGGITLAALCGALGLAWRARRPPA
jgi:uncharacterized membrane protein